jgi:hypothetical protein
MRTKLLMYYVPTCITVTPSLQDTHLFSLSLASRSAKSLCRVAWSIFHFQNQPFFQTCGESSALTIWFHFYTNDSTNRDRLGNQSVIQKVTEQQRIRWAILSLSFGNRLAIHDDKTLVDCDGYQFASINEREDAVSSASKCKMSWLEKIGPWPDRDLMLYTPARKGFMNEYHE